MPSHFKQTFDEIYEQIDMKTEVRDMIKAPLLLAYSQEAVLAVCCPHTPSFPMQSTTFSSRQWRKMKMSAFPTSRSKTS